LTALNYPFATLVEVRAGVRVMFLGSHWAQNLHYFHTVAATPKSIAVFESSL